MKIIEPKELKLEHLTKKQLLEFIKKIFTRYSESDLKEFYYENKEDEIQKKIEELQPKIDAALKKQNFGDFQELSKKREKLYKLSQKLFDLYY